MFKSIKYLRHDSKLDSYIYLLTDSDFVVEVAAPRSAEAAGAAAEAAAAAAGAEYDRRNLPVGKNLLLIAKFYENHNYDFKAHICFQDKYIPIYLKEVKYPNYKEKWKRWKKERDEYLVMM